MRSDNTHTHTHTHVHDDNMSVHSADDGQVLSMMLRLQEGAAASYSSQPEV